MINPTFAMLSCACGAEQVVKAEMADQGWRLAFSRPGFVTAKNDNEVPLPDGVFVRTASRSIGQVRGTEANLMVADLALKLAENDPNGRGFDQLHVWPKDRLPIGRFDFEPGPDEVSAVVADVVHSELSESWLKCDAPNRIAQPGDRILDLVLVEPSHWFMGIHEATVWPTRWPGAVQPVLPISEPVSRAYYKAAEAITWSGFDMRPGDLAVEIGSAPGGACGRLLELGMRVIGVDPAEMDPRIDQHRNFQHIRARGGDLPRRQFRGAKWLLVDSNVRPDQTLTTIENIVTHRQSDFVGLLVTLKIGDYSSASLIESWFERIVSWKPTQVQVRQLARNRCEVCFAVTMV
jgi:23S rRNA (cytidine2498-2'-O)-methyltransferase